MLSYSELGLGLVVSTSVRYSHAKDRGRVWLPEQLEALLWYV